MEFPAAEISKDSPPYSADEDKFFIPTSGAYLWDTFCILTPPVSPVTSATSCEIAKHWQVPCAPLDELRELDEDDELPEELFSCSIDRGISSSREESPAILNDIMWNAGERIKRPDSAMDLDVRFSLNTTPVCFDQPIVNTFVETEDLFSFSLFETAQENSQDCEHFKAKHDHLMKSIQDFSDTDEEIDVVSIQTEEEPETSPFKERCGNPTTSQPQNNFSPMKENTRFSQKQKEKKADDTSSSDSEGENNRVSHNDLERKRRNELRSRFNLLRESIPELEHNEKAAKITVLQKAYQLMPSLEKEELRLIAAKEAEKRKNAALVAKLLKLTRACKAR